MSASRLGRDREHRVAADLAAASWLLMMRAAASRPGRPPDGSSHPHGAPLVPGVRGRAADPRPPGGRARCPGTAARGAGLFERNHSVDYVNPAHIRLGCATRRPCHRTCSHCGKPLPPAAHGSRRNCDRSCRDAAEWARRPDRPRTCPSREVPCASCGRHVQRSRPAKSEPRCWACRQTPKAPITTHHHEESQPEPHTRHPTPAPHSRSSLTPAHRPRPRGPSGLAAGRYRMWAGPAPRQAPVDARPNLDRPTRSGGPVPGRWSQRAVME
jgi:hypothetical protein